MNKEIREKLDGIRLSNFIVMGMILFVLIFNKWYAAIVGGLLGALVFQKWKN